MSDQTQAAFLTGAVKRAIGEWGSYVPRIFLFAWYRSDGLAGALENDCGLLDPQGNPKPAWQALAQMLGGVPGGSDPSAPMVN